MACPPGDIGFGVAVVVAIGVVSLSTRCVFICIVIDCGTAAPHAEQTASGATSTSQRFPATDIIHQPAVSALPRRRWIVDDCRACTCVLCAVGVLLIVALLHLPCLFWPWWLASPDTIFRVCCCCWVHQFLCSIVSSLAVVPVLLRCWTGSMLPVGFWCFLFGVVSAPVALFVVLKCWSAIFRYNFL